MSADGWLELEPGFGLDHLPYGTCVHPERGPFLAVRLGERVLDLSILATLGLVPEICLGGGVGALLATPTSLARSVRTAVVEVLTDGRFADQVVGALVPLDQVRVGLPFPVGDFVDFYSSEQHATRVGRLFRSDADPLLPNWRHMPVGYHSRSGSVVVSGTDIVRPAGQVRVDGAVTFAATAKLDFEIEMGWVVGGEDRPDDRRPAIADAEDRIFGLFPLNDWSARDIQSWEYQPLGPFLGKSFATSVGGWVTPIEALEPYRVSGPPQDPEPLPYLQTTDPWGFDVDLTVTLRSHAMRSEGIDAVELARVSFSGMYWSVAQQFAHMIVNGATARPGDIAGSGTISEWADDHAGSLLERSFDGARPFELPDGTTRTYLEDGDEVVIRAQTPDGRLDLGSVGGRIVPAVV